MCDTQVLVTPEAVWFAKNSDREPSEPQPVVRFPAVSGDTTRKLRLTYIEVEQVPGRHAVVLSKPVWCWGAEMGINDAGVCIGNEAIFSQNVSKQPALLGMDLVRLGLERGATARAALDVMTALLERHGQGGAGGFTDKSFCYDNSFLIADPREAWVLESSGLQWAAKRVTGSYAISNALTLGADYELSSAALATQRVDFARRNDGLLMPFFAGAAQRRSLSMGCLGSGEPPGFARFARHLRAHRHGSESAGNGDVCMHAAGFIRRHQTTGSMMARLGAQSSNAMFTGTSAPCLSIFRPVAFGGEWSVLTPPDKEVHSPLWRRHELLHRWALADDLFRERLRATRDEIEARIWPLLAAPKPAAEALAQADRLAASWHKILFDSLRGLEPPRQSRFWRRVSGRDGIDIARNAQN